MRKPYYSGTVLRLFYCPQLGTLQLDFSMPSRFGLKYVGEDNTDHTPVMLHRAIFGSLERFIGVFIEIIVSYVPVYLCLRTYVFYFSGERICTVH